jgi:hypothetical protein
MRMHRQRWREIQNREREFFGSDYNPGNYVFTFEDGRPPHTRSKHYLQRNRYGAAQGTDIEVGLVDRQ